MNRYVIGDIHGRKKPLKSVLKKSDFDYDNDILIILGDVIDGGKNSKGVIEELLKIKNRVLILGNHEVMAMNYIFKEQNEKLWINQGGANTLNSYGGQVIPASEISNEPVIKNVENVSFPKSHIKFLKNGLYYFQYKNMLFVHGGYNPKKPVEDNKFRNLIWDRDLIKIAENTNLDFEKVFIGHTSTQKIERNWINYKCRNCNNEWEKEVENKKQMTESIKCKECGSENIFQSLGTTNPVKIGDLICMDTGAGWDGRLTMMNIDNQKIYQSKLQEPPIKNKKI